MKLEFITYFKTNFKSKTSNKTLQEIINRASKIEEAYEPLLRIRKVLWNELSLNSIESPDDWIYTTLCFWKLEKLDYVDLKVMVHLLFNENLIKVEDIYQICDLLIVVEINSIETWLSEISRIFEELTSVIPDLSIALEVYFKVYKTNIDEYWTDLASKSKSLIERPEYASELLELVDKVSLFILSKWVDAENRAKIVNYALSHSIKTDFSPDKSEAIDFNGVEFPVSYEVLGSKIQELKQTVMDSKEFENIPPKHLNSWMPKFVYSKPDVKQKIRVFFPGGKDIGHSGILIKTNEGIILFDFGLSVVNNTFPSWHPLLEKTDAVFLSHAHLDHSGGLPLLMRNGRKLEWFGTKETGILAEMLWNDTTKIAGRLDDSYLNSSNLGFIANNSNVLNAMNNFNPIEYNQPIKVLPKVEVKAHNASHLFGSAGFEINIDGKRLFYTGDFNLDNMVKQRITFPKDVDHLIFDGTYYSRASTYTPPEETLKHVLENSKRIIIPAFSMGRSQEMLFHLRNLQAEKKWKIVLTGMGGRLAKKLRMGVGPSGGGKSSGVVIANTLDNEDFIENTIVIAGQGMFQAGTSRRILEYSKDDPTTSIILCGYQAPNTLGFHLYNQHPYLANQYHQQVYRVKMSGHSSSETLSDYLDDVSGLKVMVHSPPEARERITHERLVLPTDTGYLL